MDRVDRAQRFAALGDPLRLGIVELLDVQDLSPQVLAAGLNVSSSLLAHHLRVLEDAGIVTRHQSESDRRRSYVHLEDDTVPALLHPAGSRRARRVVFVCTGNSARSILAEALWQEHSVIPAVSAGTHPAQRINPRTLTAAKRAGLLVPRRAPQQVQGLLRRDDLVVSVCDGVNEELCGLTNAHLHWSIPDPAAVDTDRAFDGALEELRDRIERLAPTVAPPRRRVGTG